MVDPFDALHQPVVPLAPDPRFTAKLRRRLRRELDRPAQEATMTDTIDRADGKRRQPPTRQAVAPYLAVHDARAAIEFYREIFEAEADEPIVMPDGRIGHVNLVIGGSTVMMADEFPEIGVVSPRSQEGSSVSLVVDVADVDTTFAAALDAGATMERPVEDQFHGARAGWLVDPFGHRWMVSTPLAAPGDADAPADEPDAPVVASNTPGNIFYFAYGVADPERARAFFTEVLGWQIEPAPNGFHIANLSPPGGVFRSGSNELTVWFRVDDIQAAVRRVRAMGGEAEEPVLYDSGWSATCRDDQGSEFSLSEPAPTYA